MELKGQIFKQSAVFNGKYFEHFGIHQSTLSMYGHESEEIVEVEMKIAADQSIPDSNDGNMDADYWGWFDARRKKFTMIYAKRFLLNMCFPSGIEICEEHGEGKAYRLDVVEN